MSPKKIRPATQDFAEMENLRPNTEALKDNQCTRVETALAGVFWTLKDIEKHTTLAPSAIYSLRLEDGTFPSPILVTSNKKIWVASEVVAWIFNRPREQNLWNLTNPNQGRKKAPLELFPDSYNHENGTGDGLAKPLSSCQYQSPFNIGESKNIKHNKCEAAPESEDSAKQEQRGLFPRTRSEVHRGISLASSSIKQEQSHCLAQGLFLSVKKGEQKERKLDVIYDYGERGWVRFKGPEQPGPDELRVLMTLVFSGTETDTQLYLFENSEKLEDRRLRQLLELKGDALPEKTLVVESSLRALTKLCGFTSSSSAMRVKEAIERLRTVTVLACINVKENEVVRQKRMEFHILSYYRCESEKGGASKLRVTLNPLLTRGVIGAMPYSKLNFKELRCLNDIALLVMQRLSGFIDEGKSRSVSLDKLCSYVWGTEPVAPNTRNIRRHRLKKVLETEIPSKTSWKVIEEKPGQYRFYRPISRLSNHELEYERFLQEQAFLDADSNFPASRTNHDQPF